MYGAPMLKNALIPHAGNDYDPSLLHPKRVAGYGVAILAAKFILVVAIFAVPTSLLMSEAAFGALEADLVARTNAVRTDYAQRPLAVHEQLEASAAARVQDLARKEYFSHVSPDGKVLEDFLRDAGYQYAVAGENLAMGFVDMGAVVATWMESASHRRNMIAADYDDIGLSMARGIRDGRPVLYIAQHFGRRRQQAGVAADAPIVDAAASQVSWTPVAGGTAFAIEVRTLEPVSRAEAQIYGVTVPLRASDTRTFTGSVTIAQDPDALFAVNVLPSVTMEHAGAIVTRMLPWERVYVPEADVWTLYRSGRTYLATAAPLLVRIAQFIFIIALIAFSIALIMGLASELRTKHPHLLGRAAALVGIIVIVFLW